MTQYLALLRGINVGGQNAVPMPRLKACFESLGFKQVRTYIQSGNVLFSAPRTGRARLTARIEQALSETFDYQARVVLRTQDELRAVVAGAPQGFGGDPDTYQYTVVFLKEPLTAGEAMKSVSLREGVDQASAGKGVLYFTRLASRASQSRLTRLIGMPVYQSMTYRNWNTTTRLLEMMEAGES